LRKQNSPKILSRGPGGVRAQKSKEKGTNFQEKFEKISLSGHRKNSNNTREGCHKHIREAPSEEDLM